MPNTTREVKNKVEELLQSLKKKRKYICEDIRIGRTRNIAPNKLLSLRNYRKELDRAINVYEGFNKSFPNGVSKTANSIELEKADAAIRDMRNLFRQTLS